MIFDRKIWKEKFTKSNSPNWKCSTCDGSSLFLQKTTLQVAETSASLGERKHPAWDPEWIESRFIAIFQCNNPSCEDNYIVSGRGTVSENYYTDEFGQQEQEWVEYYQPQYFYPSPQVITIPEECPERVRDCIAKAGSLFLGDASSAGNKIRSAVEELLNDKDVDKERLIKSRKKKLLNLHERIEKYGESRTDKVCDNLTALKWIGNSGSHDDKLSVDDILNAFEILESALSDVYCPKKANIDKLTQNINKHKGV